MVLVERQKGSGWVIRAPAVGVWSAIPHDGTGLQGGSVGLLSQGIQRLALLLPDDVGGTVSGSPAGQRRALAVEWGQQLFQVIEASGGSRKARSRKRGKKTTASGVCEFMAPTDGVFYQRPTPNAQPFVAVGDTIRLEQAIGLVEVMKTFTQVLYEGHGLPDPAVVEELLVADGAEIGAGEPLLRVRPA